MKQLSIQKPKIQKMIIYFKYGGIHEESALKTSIHLNSREWSVRHNLYSHLSKAKMLTTYTHAFAFAVSFCMIISKIEEEYAPEREKTHQYDYTIKHDSIHHIWMMVHSFTLSLTSMLQSVRSSYTSSANEKWWLIQFVFELLVGSITLHCAFHLNLNRTDMSSGGGSSN